MPDYKLGFKGPYIAAVEFGTARPTVVIDSVRLESIADEKEVTRDRWVVRFKGRDRGWVLNSTNAQLLAALWGRNTDDWVGHAVSLCSTKVRFGADTVDGIRVFGSPEIEEPRDVVVKLPRKKPVTMRLVPTGQTNVAVPKQGPGGLE